METWYGNGGNKPKLFIIKCKLKNLIKPFTRLYIELKFKNIWEVKEYIEKRKIDHGIYTSYFLEYFQKHNAFCGLHTKFKGTPFFPHDINGIYISDNASIGKNCVIFHQVTIGFNPLIDSENFGSPTIGDNVFIGAGAKIIGNIKIGNNCRIGANAVVYTDMEDNTVAVNQKTRLIKKNNLDNHFVRLNDHNKKVYYDNGIFKEVKSEK